MSILRLVFAWLVMAALPLQGFAASTMLFCEPAGHSSTSQPAGHDHAAHEHESDHDGVSQSHGSDSAGDQAATATQQQADPTQASAIDDGHACPICASCCNLVALAETPTLSLSKGSPASPPFDGPSRVSSRDTPTPHKPPRA